MAPVQLRWCVVVVVREMKVLLASPTPSLPMGNKHYWSVKRLQSRVNSLIRLIKSLLVINVGCVACLIKRAWDESLTALLFTPELFLTLKINQKVKGKRFAKSTYKLLILWTKLFKISSWYFLNLIVMTS